MVPQAVGETCLIQQVSRSAACTYLQTERLTVAPQLAYVESDAEKASPNDSRLTGNMPYHRVLRILVGSDSAASALTMRFFNVSIIVVLFTWGLIVSRAKVRRALALSWFVVSVPVGMFILSSTNTSAWAIAGVGTYWAFLLAVIRPQTVEARTRAFAVAGAVSSALVAVGARADSLVFLAGSTVVITLLAWKSVRRHKPVLWIIGATSAALVLLVLISPLRDRLMRSVNSLGSAEGADPSLTAGGLHPSVNHLLELPSFLWAFLGGQAPTFGFPTAYLRGLGWLDVGIPSLVGLFALCGAVAILSWGVSRYNGLKIFALVGALLVLVASILLPLEAANYYPEYVLQPRYFLPMLYVVVGIAAIRPLGRRSVPIVFLVLVIGAVAAANATAQLAFLHRHTNGESVPWMRLDLEASWWWLWMPIGPNAVWAIGVIAFTGFGIAVALISRIRTDGVRRVPTQQTVQGVEADHVRG